MRNNGQNCQNEQNIIQNRSCMLNKSIKIERKPKDAGLSLFNGIQDLFSKMTKQTEGWYISFTEDSPQINEKYTELIISKLYKNPTKIQKLFQAINKQLSRTAYGQRPFFITKNIILMFELVRKSPLLNYLNYEVLMSVAEDIKDTNNSGDMLNDGLAGLLTSKIVMQNSLDLFRGNFYVERIEKFCVLDFSDLQLLLSYTEKIIETFNCFKNKNKNEVIEKAQSIICDELHNSFSVLMISFIVLTKDEELGLKQKSTPKQQKTQRVIQLKLKQILKRLSPISSQYPQHLLYTLSPQYIDYQQDFLPNFMSSTYQDTTLRYFIEDSNGFNGLSFPINYRGIYCMEGNQEQPIFKRCRSQKKLSEETSKENKQCLTERNSLPQQIGKKQSKKIEDNVFGNFQNFINEQPKPIKSAKIPLQPQKNKIQNNNVSHSQLSKKVAFVDINKIDIYNYDWLNNSEITLNILSSLSNPLFSKKEDDEDHLSKQQRKKLNFILEGLKLPNLRKLIEENMDCIVDFEQLTIDKVIGSGSAGEVYLGSFKKQKIAIKKVKLQHNPNALKQFERQLLTYLKIKRHPDLVSLVGLSKSQGNYYLLTQFCNSGSLFEILHIKASQIQLSWKQKHSLAFQIAKGMQKLHQMSPIIIHRDLKSLNVFLKFQNNQWFAKVADFGLSRSPDTDMMTSALGTLHWMAPQLLENRQYNGKVDVYSFGILLWEICARRTPYHDVGSLIQIVKYVSVGDKRPRLDLLQEGCPRELQFLMRKCWHRNHKERPQFGEIINFLSNLKV